MRLATTTLVLAAGAASALALAAQPAAAAVAVSGELNIAANAYIAQGPTVTVTDTQSWNNVPATLNVTATAVATDGVHLDHNDKVTSFGTAQATWASANTGSVAFTNYGWDFSVKNPAPLDNGADLDANRPGDGTDWAYTFQATGDGVFQMNYNVTATGTKDGLFGWGIYFNGVSVGPDLSNPATFGVDPTTSGVIIQAVTAGQFYTVDLLGNPNIEANGQRFFTGEMDGLSTGISPSAAACRSRRPWAMMLAGFGGMGALLRRRRAALTA